MSERLSILKKLNVRLRLIPSIYRSEEYQKLIRLGLAHIDQAPRKIAIAILKENLSGTTEPR